MFTRYALDQVQHKPLAWAVPELLPVGKLVFLEGPTGVGKSIIMARLAALLDGFYRSQHPEFTDQYVLWLTHSDEAAYHSRYLKRQGFPSAQPCVHVVDPAVLQEYGDEAPEDLYAWINCTASSTGTQLVVIDSLEDICPVLFKQSVEQQQQFLRDLAESAERLGYTIVILHQPQRNTPFYQLSNPMNRFALRLTWHPQERNSRLLTIVKNQFGPANVQFQFIFDGEGIIDWHKTADNEQEISGHANRRGPESHVEEICSKLPELLTEPILVADLKAQLRNEGFTDRSIRVALKTTQVRSVKIGKQWWYQPKEKSINLPKSTSHEQSQEETRQHDNLNSSLLPAGERG